MINKKYFKLLRRIERFDENNFIYKTIAKRIVDSIDLLNIEIKHALEIGINENIIFNFLNNKFDNINIDRSDFSSSKSNISLGHNFYKIDPSNMDFKESFYDLIFSNLIIHLTNNFEKNLISIFKSLKNNGFFVLAIPDKENMFQLINSMYEVDIDLYNGAYQRFNPTIDISYIITILNKLKFDSPNIYSDNFTIEYSNFSNLIKDIKNMNLSYIYEDKKKNFESKNYFKLLEKIYKKKYFANDRYQLFIKINLIYGWKKKS